MRDTIRTLCCRAGGVVVCAIVVGCAGVVAGAEAEKDVSGADDGVARQENFFSLHRLDAYLEVEGDYAYDRVKSPSRIFAQPLGLTQVNQDVGFKEKVGLQFDATVIDPSVLSLTGDLGFGLTQDRFEERNSAAHRTDRDFGFLSTWDVRANILPGNDLSGSVYTHNLYDRIARRFQPALNEERTGFGTSWYFAHEKFPMELRYDFLETDRTGNRDRLDDEHVTDSSLYYGAEWIVSEHNRLKFSFDHTEMKQEYQGLHVPFDTTRDLLSLDHDLAFGDRHQHSFRTLARWQQESGDFARDFFEIGPQLSLRHTENLETLYKYQLNRERYEGLDIETHRADWQLVHQVYRNLTTTVDLFGLHENVDDDFNTTQYGASVDWQYNRKNPYGRFHANLSLAYDTEQRKGRDGPRLVLDESGTFRDPLPIILRQRNVELHTLVVTDTSNLILFLPGLDYLAYQSRDATQIVRLPTGRIPDGASVFIDYRYRTPGRSQLDTMRVDLSLEQRISGLEGDLAWLNGLTPYYRLAYRNQEDDFSSPFAQRADRTDHHRLGVRYEVDRFNLGAEYEVFDDTVDPYSAFHLDGLYHIVKGSAHSADASARFSRFFFEGGFNQRNVDMMDLELDHRWRLAESLSTFERVAYRWEDDSVDGMTHAWDLTAGVEYLIGDLTAQISLEYDRLDLPYSTQDDVGIWFRIRRDFPNVLAGL